MLSERVCHMELSREAIRMLEFMETRGQVTMTEIEDHFLPTGPSAFFMEELEVMATNKLILRHNEYIPDPAFITAVYFRLLPRGRAFIEAHNRKEKRFTFNEARAWITLGISLVALGVSIVALLQ